VRALPSESTVFVTRSRLSAQYVVVWPLTPVASGSETTVFVSPVWHGDPVPYVNVVVGPVVCLASVVRTTEATRPVVPS
jgi:hypothetical protein